MSALGPAGKGFMVYAPMIIEEAFAGFMVSILHVQRLLDTIIEANFSRGYMIAIFDEDGAIYGHYPADKRYEEWDDETVVSLYDLSWRVRIWPTAATLAAMRTLLDESALVVGLLMASVLTWLVHIAQVARHRAKEAEAANGALQYEITERQQQELELAQTRDAALHSARLKSAFLANISH